MIQNKPLCRTFRDIHEDGTISAQTLAFTDSMGFERMSPVQEAVISVFTKKRQDVAVEACTGSGKTLAFLIPCVEMLLSQRSNPSKLHSRICRVGAVCLGPTRELVQQIHSVLETYLTYINEIGSSATETPNSNVNTNHKKPIISTLVFTGGSDVTKDIDSIRGVDLTNNTIPDWTIVIGTPGRLSILMTQLKLNIDWTFRDLEVLIFDEADRLLLDKASFEQQLTTILSILPKQRRTGLFSATLSSDLKSIIKAGMRNPILIRVTISPSINNQLVPEQSDSSVSHMNTHHSLPGSLSNYFALVSREDKFAFLLKFLVAEIFSKQKRHNSSSGTLVTARHKCIIFFLSCSSASYFYKMLLQLKASNPSSIPHNATIVRLVGKMSQRSREAAYRTFSKSSEQNGGLLLATDVAARGLDFTDVSWIVQFDPPIDPAMFVHRIGRTARAGRSGKSLLLVCPPEDACIPFFRNREVTLMDLSVDKTLWNNILNCHLSTLLNYPPFPINNQLPNPLPEECPSSRSSSETSQGELFFISQNDFQWAWTFCRIMLLSDRDIVIKAASCFVSFIRAYKEHHLQFIFPFSELEIGWFATSMALLRIPRVKEILGKHVEGFTQSIINPRFIQFKDCNREKQFNDKNLARQELEDVQRKSIEPLKKKQSTQSHNTPVVHKDIIKEKEKIMKRTRSEQRRAKKRRKLEDWQELQLEERLFKKLRQGRISLSQYENQLKKVTSLDAAEEQSVLCATSPTPIEDNNSLNHNDMDSDMDSDAVSSVSKDITHQHKTQRKLKPSKVVRWIKGGRRGGKKK